MNLTCSCGNTTFTTTAQIREKWQVDCHGEVLYPLEHQQIDDGIYYCSKCGDVAHKVEPPVKHEIEYVEYRDLFTGLNLSEADRDITLEVARRVRKEPDYTLTRCSRIKIHFLQPWSENYPWTAELIGRLDALGDTLVCLED